MKTLIPLKILRTYCFLGIIILSCLTASSQNVDKHYLSLTHAEGTMFFIKPQKGFKANRNDFIFDITADTHKDSVIFNFSFYDKRSLKIDSINFYSTKIEFSEKVTSIFVESERSNFHYRKTADIYFNDIFKFFSCDNPKIIVFAEDESIEFDIRKRRWRRLSGVVHRILSLVELNR